METGMETSMESCKKIFDQVLDESWKTPARIRNMVRIASEELKPHLAPTPARVVKQWGRVRLLAYHEKGKEGKSPILLVPSIINKYYIFDLQKGQSLVEYLLEKGIGVYCMDWGTPGAQDRYASLEDHILRWQGAAVRASCKDANVAKIHLLGYCVGGTFAAVYTALRPKRVAGLITLTAPINFHDEGLLSSWASGGELPVEKLEEEWGMIPADFLQSAFSNLIPGAGIKKNQNFLENAWNEDFLIKFLALESWLNDNVDFPGKTYTKYLRDLYQNNQLIRGEFFLNEEQVDLSQIRCPLLNLVAKKDHIVPEKSASILNDSVKSKDKKLISLPSGHIGITIGGAAKKGMWNELAAWLEAHPVEREEM